jgi:hypothetical protein
VRRQIPRLDAGLEPSIGATRQFIAQPARSPKQRAQWRS